VLALLKKNYILAYRNRTSTFLRVFASFFFILLIFLVNEGIKGRYLGDQFYKDVKSPSPRTVGGIPACPVSPNRPLCKTLGYVPAPSDEFSPDADYANIGAFTQALVDMSVDVCSMDASGNPLTCGEAECAAGCMGPACAACGTCCETWRVHRVVRGIMASNGTVEGGKVPIPSDKVVGFRNATYMETFMLNNPGLIQGAYVFSSKGAKHTTFLVTQNSSSGLPIRGEWEKPYVTTTVPMIVLATSEIARKAIFGAADAELPIELDLVEFAHPAFDVATFEGFIAPLFILGCSLFPFVIQMSEVVYDKENKFRQALGAMGLHDLSYWLSWHIYQSSMAFVSAFFLYLFGCLFQFNLFLKNDFGVLFLTFWLFGQAMIGLGFLVASILSRSATAVTIGFGSFLLGFLLYFVVVFGFPYGTYNGAVPFSYTQNITTGDTVVKDTADVVAAPIFAMIPPSLLIKDLNDFGALSASEKDMGLRFADAYSYCTPDKSCDPQFSVGKSWEAFLAMYILYSLLGLYLDNVVPDAMGVRKGFLYFLSPTYWGFGTSHVHDEVVTIEASTDEDVLAEEKAVQLRCNQPMTATGAIEIRGLVQKFKRGSKPFYAVKAPWYAVERRQLFALLGPNGAGKSTTINMLTGFLPPSSGNALVFGNTVSTPSGMAHVRRLMGVCPQFDILWDNLSAKQHLELFGSIKGLPKESISTEADKRLEEVRLTQSANQRAGAFSGGMKRRLSVAIALIGNPEVVYLDEPTTGMDPINRRHVWDVIEAAKQDRCVVLTTHSMEEADILGDRIGIMAKGRLRCLGNSVRLKTRFGAGYKISISVGDHVHTGDPKWKAVKDLMKEELQAEPVEQTKAYMHFNVPSAATSDDEKMSRFFKTLEGRRGAIGITDVQLSMSTLEDVFLSIARQSERDEAMEQNKMVQVELKSGESVMVPVGSEDPLTSPGGTTFSVVWGTDDDGRLIVVDTRESGMRTVTHLATAPFGATAGAKLTIEIEGAAFQVEVPDGVAPGGQFNVAVQIPVKEGPQAQASIVSQETRGNLTFDEVASRVKKLSTPFSKQAGALFTKNLAFQRTKKISNCCLVAVPLVFLGLLLALQALIEAFLLGQNIFRCPYCGPPDAYAKKYCVGQDCVEFFFPEKQRTDFISRFDVDVVAECRATSETCGGGGSIDCFLPKYALGAQIGFCPFPSAPAQPVPSYAPIVKPSPTPVLYSAATGNTFADDLASKMGADAGGDVGDKLAGAARTTSDLMSLLLGAVPIIGCAAPSNLDSLMTMEQEAAVCKLLQEGTGSERPCCVDVTSPASAPSASALRLGVNYWSINANHTDAAYNAHAANCTGTLAACNMAIMATWRAEGAEFATGEGKQQVLDSITSLGQPQAFTDLLAGFYSNVEKFRCVAPAYTPPVAQRLDGKCMPLEEGLAIVAKYTGMPIGVYPNPEPNKDIPECTENGDCEFLGTSGGPLGNNVALSGGRWAQVCDFYTETFLADVRAKADFENGGSAADLLTYVSKVPCICAWLVAAKSLVAFTSLPSGPVAPFLMGLPNEYNCPFIGGQYRCIPFATRYHPFSLPGLKWATPAFAQSARFVDTILSVPRGTWWNRDHVYDLDEDRQKLLDDRANLAEPSCQEERNCWITIGRQGGVAQVISQNCTALGASMCYLKRMGNLTGLQLGCVNAKPSWLASMEEVNKRLYDGHYDQFAPAGTVQVQEEFINAYDLKDTDASKLRATLSYNETTVMTGGNSGNGPPPRQLRLEGPISILFDAFINSKMGGAAGEYTAAIMGINEMPVLARNLNFDLGSTLGPFFFTMAMNLLFPAIVVALVYEKEMKLRVMMRMMGLSSTAYWVINYCFWFVVYVLFVIIFLLLASIIQLPSGYTLGMITKQDYSVHLIFFFLFVNHTISFAFLWATLIRVARNASVSAVLWVLSMSLIAYLAWDQGNFWNARNVSQDAKNFITIFPVWNFYRGLSEFKEYASLASITNNPGMTWSDISSDPRSGMGAVLIILTIEWPIFLLVTLYLDQVIDSGHGVPKHPLFFLSFKHKHTDNETPKDVEADGGGVADLQDVKKEEARVQAILEGHTEQRDAVLIQAIGKIYPAYSGNPSKVAVKTLTMGVQHGECFGMLGPNGAGKTTTINMLVGFTQPTHGTATIQGFDITREMDRIYTIMGVCPQHDILWENLTARQHMMFYGRLKNLRGAELGEAVSYGLKQVNLLNVIDEKAGTFSGGMKRRLSVAVSMIGSPLCCYLDEPSSGLDPASRRTLWACIKEAKKNRAIFLTTHSMEEAEGLCDRLGIFVDGALRCIGNPKELTSRFGGFYILTITSAGQGSEEKVSEMVHSLVHNVRITYSLSGTQKFEIPIGETSLAKVFDTMKEAKKSIDITDWGIANTTLEEAFIKISRGAVGT